ncbi:MAG: transketolase C-terminal domain-containing protein, partial [Bacteroidales bacterium]
NELNIDVEVLDLRSLSPLDEEAILATVRKTNRVIVVTEDKVFGGFSGEIAAMINEKAFEHLDAPVMRVGSTFTPVGFNPILEKAILPDVARIREAIKKMVEY